MIEYLYLLPISLLLVGLYQSFNYWSNRKKYFKNIAKSHVSQSVGSVIGQVGFGYSSIFGGMIFGNIVGSGLSVTTLIKKFIFHDKKLLKQIDKKIMIKQMKKYKDFPMVNSFHVFSDVAKTSFSTMMIASFFGSAVLGSYALSLRILQAPLGIIGSSFGQVLYQRFNATKENNESVYKIAKNILIKLILAALPIFSILYFIAPDLFAFVFGEKWRVTGEYTQILLPYLFMNFLLSPISQIPIILGKQKEFFYISLASNIVLPVALYFYHETNRIEVILYNAVIIIVIIQILELVWLLKISRELK